MRVPLKILALGSPHGDDQAAWRVIESLQSDPTFGGQCVPIASPWDVVSYLANGGALIIVDACKSGAVSGTIHEWSALELKSDHGIRTSSHGGSLVEAFELARSLGHDLSEVVVYGIELESTEPGAILRPAVRHAVEELARRLRTSFADK
jgi:hydrogenase maturation protease